MAVKRTVLIGKKLFELHERSIVHGAQVFYFDETNPDYMRDAFVGLLVAAYDEGRESFRSDINKLLTKGDN